MSYVDMSMANPAINDVFFSQYLRPVVIENCDLERLGRKHDGGYVGCQASLGNPIAAFSYGIGGRDSWGCNFAKKYHLPVYQFDPFNVKTPPCNKNNPLIHFKSIGVAGHDYKDNSNNKVFETFQTSLNNFAPKGPVMVKMDIEGNEWRSLETILQDGSYSQITQLVLETHGLLTSDNKQAHLIKRVLKGLYEKFYIVHLHTNNYGCNYNKKSKLPGHVIEITYVNRNISGLKVSQSSMPKFPHALDSPNGGRRDCPIDVRFFQ